MIPLSSALAPIAFTAATALGQMNVSPGGGLGGGLGFIGPHFVETSFQSERCEYKLLVAESGFQGIAYLLPSHVVLQRQGPDGDPTNTRPGEKEGSQFVAHLNLEFPFHAINGYGGDCNLDTLREDRGRIASLAHPEEGRPMQIFPVSVTNIHLTVHRLFGVYVNQPSKDFLPKGFPRFPLGGSHFTLSVPIGERDTQYLYEDARADGIIQLEITLDFQLPGPSGLRSSQTVYTQRRL